MRDLIVANIPRFFRGAGMGWTGPSNGIGGAGCPYRTFVPGLGEKTTFMPVLSGYPSLLATPNNCTATILSDRL